MAGEDSREGEAGRGIDNPVRKEKMVLDEQCLYRELELLATKLRSGYYFPRNARLNVRADWFIVKPTYTDDTYSKTYSHQFEITASSS